MLEGQTIAPTPLFAAVFPKAPAVMRILSRYDRQEVENFIEIAVFMLDALDGDPDLENATDAEDDHSLSPMAFKYSRGPGCFVGDPGDVSATEWHTRGRNKLHDGLSGKSGRRLVEDDEDDDPDDGHVDEDVPAFSPQDRAAANLLTDGVGCPVADPGGCEHDGREEGHDAEREQMTGDVPMLPVFTAEHNVFNDKRTYLGLSNLQSSFRSNGSEVRSADTGNLLVTNARSEQRHPGSPV